MKFTDDKVLLKLRILNILSDDEEFLEEIFIHANFEIEEDRTSSPSVVWYRSFSKRFRLADVLSVLACMAEDGLVGHRTPDGFDVRCESTAKLYRLTDKGREAWKRDVHGKLNNLFE